MNTPTDDDTGERSHPVGAVRHDERGHAIWQWASDTARSALNSTSAMLRKLEVPGLSLQDDPPPREGKLARPITDKSSAPGPRDRGGTAAQGQPYGAYNGQRVDKRIEKRGDAIQHPAAPRPPAPAAAKAAVRSNALPASRLKSPQPPVARSSWWQRLLGRD